MTTERTPGRFKQLSRLAAQRERAVDLLVESPQLTETLTARVTKLDEQIGRLRSQVTGAQATQQEQQQRRAQVSDVLAAGPRCTSGWL